MCYCCCFCLLVEKIFFNCFYILPYCWCRKKHMQMFDCGQKPCVYTVCTCITNWLIYCSWFIQIVGLSASYTVGSRMQSCLREIKQTVGNSKILVSCYSNYGISLRHSCCQCEIPLRNWLQWETDFNQW